MKLANLSHILCFCQGLKGEEREEGREEERGKEGMALYWLIYIPSPHTATSSACPPD